MKILSVVGTRPNFMKIAPLVKAISEQNIEHTLVHTGQHYDEKMSKLFFEELEIPKPDVDLGVGKGTNEEQVGKMYDGLNSFMQEEKPDLVIVVGDVNSTLAGAKAAKANGIKVAHVEAGLRSFDQSMPEEINRIETDKISDYLFTTEKSGNENLGKENVPGEIHFVGNVMIDTLLNNKEKALKSEILSELKLEKGNYTALTLHRPSNVDTKEGLQNILSILEEIPGTVVFPIHPRTRKNIEQFDLGKDFEVVDSLQMIDPIGYLDFLCLMSNAKLVLTDSGGIQEETTVLGVPCITLRDNTERPVTVSEGTNLLVSTDVSKVTEKAKALFDGNIDVSGKVPELWDGRAAERIVKILLAQAH